MNLLDLPDDWLLYCFQWLNSFDLLMIKCVSTKTYSLLLKYKEKKKKKNETLFQSKADLWCQTILNISPSRYLFVSYYTSLEIDEHFMIAIGCLLDQFKDTPIENKIMQWSIERQVRRQALFDVKLTKSIKIKINVVKILDILETNYSREVISESIRGLQQFISRAEKPYTEQDTDGFKDFYHNIEEFFWGVLMYFDEEWFISKYPRIYSAIYPCDGDWF